ncbi:MAG: hypothetical protein ACQEQD_08260 [Bacillota bacterium]
MELSYNDGNWTVKSVSSRLEMVDKNVKAHDKIKEMAKGIHEKTIPYVRQPIGTAERDITFYVSRVMDSSVIQIINDAQLWWAENKFKEDPVYAPSGDNNRAQIIDYIKAKGTLNPEAKEYIRKYIDR